MLNRSQLILLTIMATLGGSFAGLLVCGILANDLTFALINLGLIVALFAIVFVFGAEKTAKNQEECSLSRNIYLQALAQREEYARLSKQLYVQNDEAISKIRRAGDVHVGGEVLPEFK